MALQLFVTDLDNTLVGDDRAMAELNQQLQRLRQSQGTKLVYSTGRSFTSYQTLRQEKDLLTPDVLVAAVGTEIYRDNAITPDPTWWDHIQDLWDRPALETIALAFPELMPQPSPEQRPYKISFYIKPEHAPGVMAQLDASLKAEGLAAQFIYSGGRDFDILPLRADKGSALEFLRQQWQIPPVAVVACGDSGNDRLLLGSGQHWGIVVGNAHPELLAWYHRDGQARHYLAQAHCAAGILEGLRSLGFLAP